MDRVFKLIKEEEKRQKETLMMIPSENYTYPEVRRAVGSVLMHKYSEGYAKRRYYQGNKFIDEIETLAVERAKKLFKVPYANVQPYSGSPANSAVTMALIIPGETMMGMKLSVGGHLTHGHPDITFSGKFFRSVQFGTGKDGLLDYDDIWKLAKKEKPKLMLIGTTSYPLAFNWKKFAEIADSIDAWLVADISHVIGLIVAGVYPSPVNYVHAITSTTHKTLRGPRGAIIWATKKGVKKDAELPSRISKAVFPGLQGGPHNNTTAGIAVALELALKPEFKKYGQQVTKNAKVLANELKKGGLTLYANGTQCHLVVVDLIPMGLSGNVVAEALEEAGIVINRNSVPDDPMPPFYPSGIRLGSPALTARGMKEKEMVKVSEWILKVIDHVKIEKLPTDPAKLSEFLKAYRLRIAKDKFLKEIASEVKSLCNKFPTP